LVIIARDETGDLEFVIFGRIAQRLMERTADALVAINPPGFIPDEITRLLEKVFTFNVSFTEKIITSDNVSFQVNTVVAEIDDRNPLPVTPIQSQTSSILFSQGASSNVQDTPEEDTHASNTTSMVHTPT
jgi:regulator of protease activity HflC (stomatin/prohibitin superfamily)